jgi:hypothetical protein
VFKPAITTNFHRKKFKRNKINLQKQLDSLTLTLATAHGNSKKNSNSLHWVDVRMRFQNTAKEREREREREREMCKCVICKLIYTFWPTLIVGMQITTIHTNSRKTRRQRRRGRSVQHLKTYMALDSSACGFQIFCPLV